MVFGVHLNDLIFYSHHALWGICFAEIVCAPEQTANEYLATFICNKLGADIRKVGIGIPAVAAARRNKPAYAVFQRKLYSFQQLAVFVSLDYFQPGLYLSVVYADPRFAVFYLEILARRYDHVPFRGFYFFQNVFAQGEVFKGKGAVLAGDYRGRIFFFIGKRSKACPIDLYILPLGVPDYKLRAGKRRFSVLCKFCDGELGMFVFYGFKLYNSLRTIRTVNRHLYRGCLNIPLRCFDLGNCILSKRKPCKRHHAIPPACGFLGYAVAADLKLNAFKRLPIVALLDERQRVFFQCILYCRFYVPVIVSAYLERPYGFIQCITVGRGNFLNIIRSGLQVCKQRFAVPVGMRGFHQIAGGGSVLIKPEKSLRKQLVAIGLGYAYAALIAGVSPCQSYGFASKADSFWQVVYGCSTVSLYFHGNGSVISSVTLRGSFFDYRILPGFQPGKLRNAVIIGGFLICFRA